MSPAPWRFGNARSRKACTLWHPKASTCRPHTEHRRCCLRASRLGCMGGTRTGRPPMLCPRRKDCMLRCPPRPNIARQGSPCTHQRSVGQQSYWPCLVGNCYIGPGRWRRVPGCTCPLRIYRAVAPSAGLYLPSPHFLHPLGPVCANWSPYVPALHAAHVIAPWVV